MKKKWMIALLTLFTSFIAIGTLLSNIIMFLKIKDSSYIKNREVKAKRWIIEEFDALPKSKILVPSPFGYYLDCLFINPYPDKKWMIFCHGVTESKYNSIRHMNLFIKKGFNAIIYDHRRHGESGGKTSSYGYYEKWDLEAIINELKRQQGEDVLFGIHGESMGAATALLYAGSVRDDAAFYVADCPFSSFEEQLKYRIKAKAPVPPWMLMPIGNLFLKIRDGYRIQDVSPLIAVGNIKKPVLFIHSELDDYIPLDMTRQLYEAKQGPKQLFIAPKGLHAQSINENLPEYEQAVDNFLQTFLPYQL